MMETKWIVRPLLGGLIFVFFALLVLVPSPVVAQGGGESGQVDECEEGQNPEEDDCQMVVDGGQINVDSTALDEVVQVGGPGPDDDGIGTPPTIGGGGGTSGSGGGKNCAYRKGGGGMLAWAKNKLIKKIWNDMTEDQRQRALDGLNEYLRQNSMSDCHQAAADPASARAAASELLDSPDLLLGENARGWISTLINKTGIRSTITLICDFLGL